ncbi:MAG: NAD-dependent epimerase/dehydratase family protein [Synergistaceae bacterium]|nr:NAD-dependent epimerase/dehydratase family protein [Synergistaceae bacterium]
MKNTIYLLTGAAGFLGSNVSRALIKQGKTVRTLVLPGDPAAPHVPREAEVIQGNLLDVGSLEKFFSAGSGTDIVVLHCASLVTVSDEFSQKLYDINVGGTRNILDKCLEHRVKKLVYVSSTSTIPELPRGQRIQEVSRFDPKTVTGVYAQTKAEATQLVADAAEKAGLDASIIFPSGICGPNDYAYGYFTKSIIDIAAGKIPAGFAGSFNMVDARDLADGIIACAEKGRKGEGYILSSDIVTFHDIFELVSRYTGAKRVKTIVPLSVLRIIAFFCKIYGKITKKPPLITNFMIYNMERNNDFSSAKAISELGYSPRPFDETIRDTVEWLISEGKIDPKNHGKE